MSRVDRSTVCVGLLVLLMPVLAGSATADYSYVAPGIGNQDFRRGEPDDPSPHSQPIDKTGTRPPKPVVVPPPPPG